MPCLVSAEQAESEFASVGASSIHVSGVPHHHPSAFGASIVGRRGSWWARGSLCVSFSISFLSHGDAPSPVIEDSVEHVEWMNLVVVIQTLWETHG